MSSAPEVASPQGWMSRPHPSGLRVEVDLPAGVAVELHIHGQHPRVLVITELVADLVLDAFALVVLGTRDAAVTDPHGAVEVASVRLVGAVDCDARITGDSALVVELSHLLCLDRPGRLRWADLSSLLSLSVAALLESSLHD